MEGVEEESTGKIFKGNLNAKGSRELAA